MTAKDAQAPGLLHGDLAEGNRRRPEHARVKQPAFARRADRSRAGVDDQRSVVVVMAGRIVPESGLRAILPPGYALAVGELDGPGDAFRRRERQLGCVEQRAILVAVAGKDAETRGLALEGSGGVAVPGRRRNAGLGAEERTILAAHLARATRATPIAG